MSDEQADFETGVASVQAAKGLAGSDKSALLTLIRSLAEAGKRAHLEALSLAGLGKDVKKAARKAAYKLKSAGVGEELKPEGGIDLSATIELDKIASLGAAGLDGHSWLIVSDIPGYGGGEIDLRPTEEGIEKHRVEVAQDGITASRLRKFMKSFETKAVERPVMIHADFAALMVTRLHRRLAASEGGVHPAVAHFLGWRDAIIALGADPSRAQARTTLGPWEDDVDADVMDVMIGHPNLGWMAPPQQCLEIIEGGFSTLMHSDDETTEEGFAEELKKLADDAAHAWFIQDGVPAQISDWLEEDADVLMSMGEPELARKALRLADDAGKWDATSGVWPFLRAAFVGALDFDGAWAHRQDHMRGEAHQERHDH